MNLRWLPAAMLLAAGIAACSDDVQSPGTLAERTDTHVIRDVDYIEGRYFFFDHPLVFVGADHSLPIDVYLQVMPAEIVANPEMNRIRGIGLLDRDGFGTDIDAFMSEVHAALQEGSSLTLDQALRDVASWYRPVLNGEFRLLVAGADYELIADPRGDVTGLELTEPLSVSSSVRALAVRYTNTVQAQTGTPRPFGVGGNMSDWAIPFDVSAGEEDRLVIEVIFASTNSRPGGYFGFTWSYMMKHVYDIGFYGIDPASFSLAIEDIIDLRRDRTRPIGSDEPYIRIFGLDRTDASGSGPDGKIDLTAGVVDLESGLLRMPFELHPVSAPDTVYAGMVQRDRITAHAGFWPDPDSVSSWTRGAVRIDGEYEQQWEFARRIYAEWLSTQSEKLFTQYNILARRTRIVTEY